MAMGVADHTQEEISAAWREPPETEKPRGGINSSYRRRTEELERFLKKGFSPARGLTL